MKATTCGLLVLLLVAAQAQGEATLTYTLELGGNNNREGWKNPPGCNPPFFTSGSTVDGQWVTCNTVTWAARVAVSGTHSNGFVPSGVANLVFSLELHAGTDTTAASLVPGFGKGNRVPPRVSIVLSMTARPAVAASRPTPFGWRRSRSLSVWMGSTMAA